MNPADRSVDPLPTVLVSGTAGVGKSIVAKEIHELLRRADMRNAVIDLDALGRVSPAPDPPFNSGLVLSNLCSMWPNFEALRLQYLVLARVVLTAGELEDCRATFPFMDLHLVRLEAPDDEVRRRLRTREPGVSQSFLMEVAPALAEELRANDFDEIVVDNGTDRPVTQVALEILTALGWPTPELPR